MSLHKKQLSTMALILIVNNSVACGLHFGEIVLPPEPGSKLVTQNIYSYRENFSKPSIYDNDISRMHAILKYLKRQNRITNIEFIVYEPIKGHYTHLSVNHSIVNFEPLQTQPDGDDIVLITEWDILSDISKGKLTLEEARKMGLIKVNALLDSHRIIDSLFF